MRIALLLSSLLVAFPAVAAQKQHVLVIGNNETVDEDLAPLRFADDDAARYAELLDPLSASLELLSVLDEETQATHPALVRRSLPPTRFALDEALDRISSRLAQDHERGDETTFVFVFVGHGNVGPNREGYVSLLDGKLTRSDLYEKVIKGVRADFTHIVIDACNAYLMVNRRGAAGEAAPGFGNLVRGYLDDDDLSRHPHVGVVLSTAGERETHEFAGFRAGVFSHEVRSALSGAADVNGDGRVEYSELGAFVAAANLKIDDPRARPEVFARPPARDRSRALVDLGAPGFEHFLLFPASFAGKFHLEDARGVRYVDFNKAADRTVALALPGDARYYLRTETTEALVAPEQRGFIDASRLTWKPLALAARGSVDATLRRSLFEVPYGPAFYRGFTAQQGISPVVERKPSP